MNPFALIPFAVRRWFYIAYGFAALGDTAVAAAFTATHEPLPKIVVGIGAALVPIGAALGATAVSNMSDPQQLVAVHAPEGSEVATHIEMPQPAEHTSTDSTQQAKRSDRRLGRRPD